MIKQIRILSLVLAGVMLMFALSACTMKKDAKSAAQFSETMQARGFTVEDVSGQFEEDATESALVAYNDAYQLEFYVLPSVDQTVSAFNGNKETFESRKGSMTFSTSVSVGNYSIYSLTTAEGFYYVSRIDNTLLYLTAGAEYKDEITEITDELGY